MARNPLNFFDYIKAAFNWKVPIKGLGFLPVNKIFLGLGIALGIGHIGFLFLTAALEMGYLWGLSSNKNFQKVVEASQMVQKSVRWDEKQNLILESLDNESRQRYYRLLDKCAVIVKLAGPDEHKIGDIGVSGLNQLVWMFLRLLSSRIKINKIIANTSLPELEKEMNTISKRLTTEKEGTAIYRSLQGTLEIQKRRLENLEKASENLKVVESELDRIEKQIILLNEEVSVSSDPELFSVRLDNVMNSLSSTSKWMSEQGEFFGMLEDEAVPANLLQYSIKKIEKE